MRRAWLAVLLLGACEVGEVDVAQLAVADHAAGKDPCTDPAIRQRINVHAEKNDPHRFVGSPGNDVIFGTNGNDQIFGLGGDDVICGLDGDDYIDGGDGRDAIDAGPGDDIVHGRDGGEGDNHISYGSQ